MAMATKSLEESPPTEDDWSKFEEDLGINEMRLSDSSSGKPKFEKLYVLLGCSGGEGMYESRVYCIDLNSSSSSSSASDTLEPLEPIAQIPVDDCAVAILGSKLYTFGGTNIHNHWVKTMFFYDLESAHPSSSETINLDKHSFQPGEKMNGKKADPVAVVIGDSKICVFGTLLYSKSVASRYPPPYTPPFKRPYFEVFDTIECTWKVLPEPLPYKEVICHDMIYINSYCVHGSCLIIEIYDHGFYGIDVDRKDAEWVKLKGSQKITANRFSKEGVMWTMVGKQLCSPFKVMRKGGLDSHPFAVKSSPFRQSLIEGSPDNKEGVLCVGGANLFIVRTGFSYQNYDIPNLLVDIVKFDTMEGLGSDLSKWTEIQSHKSFTFSLGPWDNIKLFACFPVKGIDTSEDNIRHKLKEVALEPGDHLSSHSRS